MGLPVQHRNITVSTSNTHTNTTTEAAFTKQITIPANTLRVGDRLSAMAVVKATATHTSDTLTCYLMLGVSSTATKTSSTGVVLAKNTAIDVSDGDAVGLYGVAGVKILGAAGTASIASVGFGALTTLGAATSGTLATYLDTTVDQVVYVVADWSAADTGNICHLAWLDLVITPANPTESP